MASIWKYDIVVLDNKHSSAREETFWDLGRSGWEIVQIVPGDMKTGEPDAPKLTLFLKREATHDINF